MDLLSPKKLVLQVMNGKKLILIKKHLWLLFQSIAKLIIWNSK
jgi:hypothetical protein